MKRASVREVQHNLKKVLDYLDHDDEIIIVRRNKPIAKIVPVTSREKIVKLPDFKKRREKLGIEPGGTTLSEIILENRGEES